MEYIRPKVLFIGIKETLLDSYIGHLKDSYTIRFEENGEDAVACISFFNPNLVILDIVLPGIDGIEVCETIRKTAGSSDCLIIFLTERMEDYSQIAAFEAGADDYLILPVKPKVLEKRIAVLLKRKHEKNYVIKAENTEKAAGKIIVDEERYIVIKDNKPIYLPRKEFQLLSLLYSVPQKVFTREEMFRTIWGNDPEISKRTIDIHIWKLRNKIGKEYLVTVKGVGYFFYPQDKVS